MTINFKGSQRRNATVLLSEVTYSYNASTGQSGPITPGQTVSGFTNGTHRHHCGGQLECGAQLGCQRSSHHHAAWGAGHALSVGAERRAEPEIPELQLELAVHCDQ